MIGNQILKLMNTRLTKHPATAEDGQRTIKREMLRALNHYERLVEMERMPFCSVTKAHVQAAKNHLDGLEKVYEVYGWLIKDKGPQ